MATSCITDPARINIQHLVYSFCVEGGLGGEGWAGVGRLGGAGEVGLGRGGWVGGVGERWVGGGGGGNLSNPPGAKVGIQKGQEKKKQTQPGLSWGF